MSDTLPDWPDDDADLLAAEYVVGVLDENERRAIDTRVADDPAFARLVAAWEERLAPMLDGIEEIPPRAELWTAIEGRLGFTRPPGRVARSSLWNSLAFWRSLSFGAGIFAAACLAFVLVTPMTAPSPMLATIAADSGDALFIAMIDERESTMSVMPARTINDPTHAHELWIIAGKDAPVSLGVIPAGGMRTVPIASDHMELMQSGAILAVSQEPIGGSPTGLPTGPVLGTGAIQRI